MNHNVPCKRCGVCCTKGGPSLHQEDRHLVDDGRIPARALFTLRKGEMAHDNVKGKLVPLQEEIIKLKGISGRWTCRFYDPKTKGCAIYGDRPLECRVLNCRETSVIEAVYDRSRLTRKDLLSGVEGLWNLIQDHEAHCSYQRLKHLVDQGFENGNLAKEREVLEIMRYDTHVRQLTREKGGLEQAMLDFLFGRPLSVTIQMFGLQLKKSDGAYRLVARL